MENPLSERREPSKLHLPVHTQQLFVQIMDKLSSQGNPYQAIPEILKEICQFFKFGCGFIYEADYSGLFSLTEIYSPYGIKVPQSLSLVDTLSESEMQELSQSQVVIIKPEQEHSVLADKLFHAFDSNLLILLPIVDTDQTIIGMVGIADRRQNNSLTDDDYEVAQSVLAVVANQVKLHIYQNRIEGTKTALSRIIDNMGIDVYVNDFNTHEVLFANESMAAPYGGLESMVGKKCWQALYDDKTAPCDYCPQPYLIDEEGHPSKVYSWDYQRPFDGSWFRVLSAAFPWIDGRLAHVVSSVDITENKKNEELVRQMADFDTLTKLPNRRKLLEDLNVSIDEMNKNDSDGYVLFLDLDKFKQVNDELGHRSGDELLIQIGEYFEENPLTKGHAYRHGGDEFVLTYPEISCRQLVEVITTILERFKRNWHLSDADVSCLTSIGVSHYPHDNTNAEDLINDADQAMYASKRKGKGQAFFYNEGQIITLEQFIEIHKKRCKENQK